MSLHPTIVIDEKIPWLANLLDKQAVVLRLPADAITPSALEQADAFIVRSVTTVNAALLTDTPVQFVGSPTAGFNHLDTTWLTQQKIAWYYAAGCNANAVSQYVAACIVNCQQHGLLNQKKLRAAVIGMGHIGQRVSHHLNAFGMHVMAYDPPRALRDKTFHSASWSELHDLDLICIHAASSQTASHRNLPLINSDFLDKQSKAVVVINAARGDIMDADVLQKNATAHFCLDVWPDEPHVKKTDVDRCFIATPHIAGYSLEAKQRASLMVFNALCQHFNIKNNPVSIDSEKNRDVNVFSTPHWKAKLLSSINPLALTEKMKKAFIDPTIRFSQYRQSIPWWHEL